MSDPRSVQVAHPDYEARIPSRIEIAERGLVGEDGVLLEWVRLELALAAGIGEPQGVSTILFDLIERVEGPDCVAYRLRADSSEEAMALGRDLEAAIGAERCDPALLSLAKDGTTSRWYPDIESFERSNLAALRSAGGG